ncbi:hypothetical protein CKO28_16440 [Rhodovibrio sodomensis]|uniref:Uncharacterized protein n=1 Tax=Rhodovibrio sodomensis TaxID=1088 RepID=A0ABS1DHD2_9PROT|nr:hypothetical protein [Rhodovibrio sodomensis]MBK1669629.1 hypothetical protein [Rhodovibrio sodomensis]
MEIVVIGLLGIIAAALLFGGATVLGALVGAGMFVVYTLQAVIGLALLGALLYWLSGQLETLAVVVPIVGAAIWLSIVLGEKLEDRRREREGMLPRSRR